MEFRSQIIRLVRTLRGGDRPKNFEEEFADVSSLPKGGSTIAACEFEKAQGIGLERLRDYFDLAKAAVPRWARLGPQQPTLF